MTTEQLNVLNDIRNKCNQADAIIDIIKQARYPGYMISCAVLANGDPVGIHSSEILPVELCERLVKVAEEYSSEMHNKFNNITIFNDSNTNTNNRLDPNKYIG